MKWSYTSVYEMILSAAKRFHRENYTAEELQFLADHKDQLSTDERAALGLDESKEQPINAYYPPDCQKYGHDHSGSVRWYMWSTHNVRCQNFGGFWRTRQCEHIQTFEEAILEANDGKWPEPPAPPPPLPPKEVHVYHHDTAPSIKKGDIVYIRGMNKSVPKKVRVKSIRKKGDSQELEVESL